MPLLIGRLALASVLSLAVLAAGAAAQDAVDAAAASPAPAAPSPAPTAPSGDMPAAPAASPTVPDGAASPASSAASPPAAPPPPAPPAAQTATQTRAAAESQTAAPAASASEGDADVDAYLAGLDDADAAVEPMLAPETVALYGFADFTFDRLWSDGPTTRLSPYGTFYVGNLNVYLDAQLDEQWRALSEVRFTYLPHGTFDLERGSVVDSTALDYADGYGETRIGGIEIERAWIDYAPHAFFAIRGGQWLTPYGIWNVDHGSPALIGIQKPFLTRAQLLPERQTGLMAHGTVPLSAAFDLAYHATLSNGRGGVDEYRDLDANKAIGVRLELRHLGVLRVNVGATAYAGRFTQSQSVVSVMGDEIGIALEPVEQYDEQSLAADLRVTWRGLEILGEFVMNDRAYVAGLRPHGLEGLSPDLQADVRRWGAYGVAGYTIEALRLQPFFGFDHMDDSVTIGEVDLYRFGLRFMPVPPVTLKGELTHAVPVSGLAGTDVINALRFQVAWAFR